MNFTSMFADDGRRKENVWKSVHSLCEENLRFETNAFNALIKSILVLKQPNYSLKENLLALSMRSHTNNTKSLCYRGKKIHDKNKCKKMEIISVAQTIGIQYNG